MALYFQGFNIKGLNIPKMLYTHHFTSWITMAIYFQGFILKSTFQNVLFILKVEICSQSCIDNLCVLSIKMFIFSPSTNQMRDIHWITCLFYTFLTMKFFCCNIAMRNWYINIDISFFYKFIQLRVKVLIHNVGFTNYTSDVFFIHKIVSVWASLMT